MPSIKGYCIECVRKLKAKYDRCLEALVKLQDEADNYNGKDQEKAQHKLELMRAKAEQY